MQMESTSGGGSHDGEVKVCGEARVNGEAGAHRGAVTSREAREK